MFNINDATKVQVPVGFYLHRSVLHSLGYRTDVAAEAFDCRV